MMDSKKLLKNLIYTVMKKISILIITCLSVFCLNSCLEDEEPTFVIQEELVQGPQIVTANSTVTLNKENESDQAVTIVWEDVDYSLQTPILYTLEAAAGGTGFEEPQTAGVTVDRSFTWTVSELNTLAIKSGLNAQEEGALEIRIISSVGTNGGLEKSSRIIILTLTPYSTEVPKLWLPGDYAEASGYGANWKPSDPLTPTLAAESFTSSKFEGYVYFANDNSNFKITPTTSDDFEGNYGDVNDSGTSGTLLQDAASKNIVVATAGYYKINVDIEALTYTLTKTDWAITGAATPNGWPSDADPIGTADTDLIYNQTTKVWEQTLNMTSNEFKFRANDAWDLNYGGDPASLSEGGDNLSLNEGGNYTVTLDFSTPRVYSFTLVKN